ncbi:S24 family peptidase [Ewingella sp. CoE-038-23]|uniref:XRE family transcriptional regulator n=1 Tax=Ewingella docleensis TaxID=3118588 RepID=UPI0033659C9C
MKTGERIRKLRLERKITLQKLADMIDSDVGNLSRLERGKQGFSEPLLQKISDALRVPLSELFSDQEDSDTVNNYSVNSLSRSGRDHVYRVDVLNVNASAGSGSAAGDVIEVIRSIEYVPEHAKALFGNRPEGSVMLINVRGDSMTGTLEPGDLIFVDTKVNFFDGDGIYVFNFNGDTFVKRLQKVKFDLKVISDNKTYETWSLSNEEIEMLHVQGKVLISQSQQIRRHG